MATPSLWFDNRIPKPASSASLVEYLRWMRVYVDNGTIKSGTILELFQKFENKSDSSRRLQRLCDRIERLADESFIAECSWRVRVGGLRGPEQMLLPAFDASGIPYIPSSTLKGIARSAAEAEVGEKRSREIFGTIETDSNVMGQVAFLDAYPLPDEEEDNSNGGLSLDIANQIWKWEGTQFPRYNTNPNLFVSLKESRFRVGLRKLNCDDATFARVVNWLKLGLSRGIGAQVNSGYGTLIAEDTEPEKPLMLVRFELTGQLIHGHQEFNEWKTDWNSPGNAVAELRPIAFRSMLRYWFRALAAGVLSNAKVQELEMDLFGGLEPPRTGVFRLEVDGTIERLPSRRSPGLMKGNLSFFLCSCAHRQVEKSLLKKLLQYLTWLAFHLGGVGQGARRPCYDRTQRANARPPYWRGSTLKATSSHPFWANPDNVEEFQELFAKRMRGFYKVLGELVGTKLNFRKPRSVRPQLPTETQWAEAIDVQCEIVCVAGKASNYKPFALAELHSLAYQNDGSYNPALCGDSNTKPSPIWIADIDSNYQVVTVFGAREATRMGYLDRLNVKVVKASDFVELWPLPKPKKKT
ncbi:RAMP superfamily CRISPR-associated protein [Spirulina sp. 06S082]|uniref:RAMP superfamily CRISPR-associated protein n=1 Tax=Spirulina sp. 06S082 TaxID=3110248 RepID=UPI002B21710D|nr:RAMP superfamily CRISPR-associated protein [Spirulina sp. 06S082]MEA5470084.1 RAMP superfamily CRISPR-associated protein [Spirulina sp. 06S082]